MSGARYPWALSTLGSTGAIPTDEDPLRAIHFNRLFREISAIEYVLGRGVQGSRTDLVTRLAQSMNDDGTFKSELLCEDDPTGNARGSCRWFDSGKFTTGIGAAFGYTPLAYAPWDDPPICFATVHVDGSWVPSAGRMGIRAVSEVGVRFDYVTDVNPYTLRLNWIAISRNLKIFEDDKAWMARPIRTGSA